MSAFAPLSEFSFEAMQETTEWWDTLWQSSFVGVTAGDSSMTMIYFLNISKIILCFVFPFWLFALANSCGLLGGGSFSDRTPELARMFLASFLVIVMTGNDGAFIGNVAMESRNVIQGLRDETYQIQILNNQLGAALQDAFWTNAVSDRVRQSIATCEKIPHLPVAIPSINPPPGTELTQDQQNLVNYFQCYIALQKEVEALESQSPDACFGNDTCRAFGNLTKRIISSIDKAVTTEAQKLLNGEVINIFSPFLAVGDVVAGASAMAAVKPVLAASQWIFVSGLELSLWLAAVIAPLAIAFALIPGQFNVFATWALGFFSIGLIQILYALLIGVFALLFQQTSTANITEIGFPIMLALGAPYAASKIVFKGASAVADAYQQKAVTTASAGLAVGGAAATGGTSMAALAAAKGGADLATEN